MKPLKAFPLLSGGPQLVLSTPETSCRQFSSPQGSSLHLTCARVSLRFLLSSNHAHFHQMGIESPPCPGHSAGRGKQQGMREKILPPRGPRIRHVMFPSTVPGPAGGMLSLTLISHLKAPTVCPKAAKWPLQNPGHTSSHDLGLLFYPRGLKICLLVYFHTNNMGMHSCRRVKNSELYRAKREDETFRAGLFFYTQSF